MDDFDLYDIVDEANFDQFIEIIRGECGNSEVGFNAECATGSYNHHPVNGAAAFSVDNQLFDLEPGLPDVVFQGLNSTSSVNVFEQNSLLVPLPSIDVMDDVEEELGGEEEDQNDSSTTTSTKTSNTPLKKPKADRSKTLVSERKRRGRMKEKLYALRSLVPYISKMDKASIVGDAVHYIQELQTKARNLKTEINDLEISILNQASIEQPKTFCVESKKAAPICRTTVQMEAFQVEEKGFYVRIVSQKGDGIGSYLYRAIESLDGFTVQSSNLSAGSDKFVLTVTLNVKEEKQIMSLSNLKLWITAALFNQGFDLQLSP